MCTVSPVLNTDVYGDPEHDGWLSIGEAASLLGLSIETLRRYDASGRLKAFRSPGNQRRYRRSQINAALTSEGVAG